MSELEKDPALIEEALREFPAEVREQVRKFYHCVLEENQVQNLTRITSLQDFVENNIIDVLELLKSELVQYPAMDLGSGAGIPGLLAALLDGEQWILAESEKRKAEYLQKTVNTLGLSAHVRVVASRAEDFLSKSSVQSVVFRAVGPVERVYTWLRPCSTWNNLILLKGPKWEEEWSDFQKTKFRNELQLAGEHFYEVGTERKKRRIIRLKRVERPKK